MSPPMSPILDPPLARARSPGHRAPELVPAACAEHRLCRKVPGASGASGEPALRRVERGHGSCRDLPPPASNRHAGLCRLHWPL